MSNGLASTTSTFTGHLACDGPKGLPTFNGVALRVDGCKRGGECRSRHDLAQSLLGGCQGTVVREGRVWRGIFKEGLTRLRACVLAHIPALPPPAGLTAGPFPQRLNLS